MSSELNSNNNINRNVQLEDKNLNYSTNTNISTQFSKRNEVNYNREHEMRVSGANGVTPLSLIGYNEKLARNTQDSIELNKLSNFGDYADRSTMRLKNVEIPVVQKSLKENNSYNKTIQEMGMRQFIK
jgi:hypothetical protein